MNDLELLRDAVLQAGSIGMLYFRQNPEVTIKGDTSPVTEADLAIDQFLKSHLIEARPDYGWLSEETVDAEDRLAKTRIFIVDPIDGTRAFIEGSQEWCISIAVVEHGVPVAGVLFQPSTNTLYLAEKGHGATINDAVLKVVQPRDPLLIGGPKPFFDAHQKNFPMAIERTRHVPSLALRIAYVAEGKIDGAFIKPNAHDWDIAAAMLILQEAGGDVTDVHGTTIALAAPNPRHSHMLCGSDNALAALRKVAVVAGIG